jgi:hypothetical protein
MQLVCCLHHIAYCFLFSSIFAARDPMKLLMLSRNNATENEKETLLSLLLDLHRDGPCSIQIISCGIYGRQSGSGACFLLVLRFPLRVLIPPNVRCSSRVSTIGQIVTDLPSGPILWIILLFTDWLNIFISRVLIQKLIVDEMVKKFSTVYGLCSWEPATSSYSEPTEFSSNTVCV